MGKSSEEYYHDKAEKDYSQGRYERPDWPSDLFTKSSEKFVSDAKAYDKGYNNAKKQDPPSSRCFLTTACTEHAGLTDDCHELQVLRRFRDNYVSSMPNGWAVIAEYYEQAPAIVGSIQSSPRRHVELESLFVTITEAVALIEDGHNRQAFDLYAAMYKELKARFLLNESLSP